MGYIGHSMSERAALAYEYGEKPRSKWTKDALLEAIADQLEDEAGAVLEAVRGYSAEALRRVLLVNSSWHHTGSCFNRTDFYELRALDAEPDTLEGLRSELEAAKAELKAERAKKAAKAASVVRVRATWREFNPWRKRWQFFEAFGEVRGNWFVSDAGERKRVGGRHFRIQETVAA